MGMGLCPHRDGAAITRRKETSPSPWGRDHPSEGDVPCPTGNIVDTSDREDGGQVFPPRDRRGDTSPPQSGNILDRDRVVVRKRREMSGEDRRDE